MAWFSPARAVAVGATLILILNGTMTASTAADGARTWPPHAAASATTEVPIVLALADPPAADVTPGAFESMASVVAPLVHNDGEFASPRKRSAGLHKSALASRAGNQSPAAAAFGPARFFTINQVLAKRSAGTGTAAPIELAAIDPTGTTTDAPALRTATIGTEPFGLFTFRAPEGQLWAKWRKVEADMRADASVLARCQADAEHCTPAAARFNAIVAAAKAAQGRVRLALVNERVNAAIRYTSDYEQYGVADLWSAPLASLASGRGDCEDYAIAKYALLREAGVAARDLHVLLVRDNAVHLDHAVLAVRNDDHWLILDNRWNKLTEDTELHQFAPLFALDEDGVKLFAAPYAALGMQDGAAADGDRFVAGADVGSLTAADADDADGSTSWPGSLLLL
jgi:predicted transglutaminase-like cysteine proteinase